MMSSLGGIRIIESEFALVSPAAAISDDMRSMVDDLERFGQIRKKPGAYSLPDGTMIVHPTVYAELQRQITKSWDRMNELLYFNSLTGRGR